jgi:hypothetical protein
MAHGIGNHRDLPPACRQRREVIDVCNSIPMSGESDYLAYMLRLRRVWRDGQGVWQASLESPHTGERHTFGSLEVLYAFLLTATEGSAAEPSVRSAQPGPGQALAQQGGHTAEGTETVG